MAKVFISYSHDSPAHKKRVLGLADRLNREGLDCNIDQYIQNAPEGWELWPYNQMEAADFVLVVCTETYKSRAEGKEVLGKGLGAIWESQIITLNLYRNARRNDKFIPVFFSPATVDDIPFFLASVNRYDLTDESGYRELYRRLTNQPWAEKPDPGRIVSMPAHGPHLEVSRPVSNVPIPPNPLFTGRKYVLSQIGEGLKGAGAVALSGMSGSGKSQTASHYAHLHRDEYQAVLWIPADSRAALLLGLAHVALLLDLPQKDAREPEVAAGAVRRWLEAESNWLLVFDNVDDLSLLPEFLPQKVTGHLLLTTQQQALATLAQRVDMHAMEPEEGGLLLLRRAKVIEPQARLDVAKPADRQTAIEISSELGGLPLALDQAGAYVEETDCGLTEYLKLYRAHGEKLRGRRGGAAPSHPESVTVSIELCFEKLQNINRAAAELVQFCAFFHPDAIPEELIEQGAAEMGPNLEGLARDKLSYNEAIGAALRYSLLRRDAEVRTLGIHRLVQAVLRDGLDKQTERKWAERVVRAANQTLPSVEFANWPQCDRLLPHAQACAVLIRELDLETHEAARLLNQTGFYLSERARYGEAEPLHRRAVGIREKVLGPEHPDVATSLNNLAGLYDSQGKYGEAEPLYQRALGIREKALGPEHPDVANSLNNLAGLYASQRKYGEAEPLYRRALEIWEKALGPEHPDVATSLNNLALLYARQGKYGEAEPLYQRAVGIWENALGPEHPNVATVLTNYADLLKKTSRVPEADGLETRARAIRKKLARAPPTSGA